MPRSLVSVIGIMMLGGVCVSGPVRAAGEPDETSHGHAAALAVPTEDLVLKAQIVAVAGALGTIHEAMAQRRRAIQQAAGGPQKAVLYTELDGLRKEHDMLERLLHELVEEAQATEWTKIDEALKRAKPFERRQEEQSKREDDLRERQQ